MPKDMICKLLFLRFYVVSKSLITKKHGRSRPSEHNNEEKHSLHGPLL